jgi:hypothetical protein
VKITVISEKTVPARRPRWMHPHQDFNEPDNWVVTYEAGDTHRDGTGYMRPGGAICKWIGPWDAMPKEIRRAVQVTYEA